MSSVGAWDTAEAAILEKRAPVAFGVANETVKTGV